MKYTGIVQNVNDRSVVTHAYVYCDGAFTDQDLDKIINYCESVGFQKATVGGEVKVEESIRTCDVKFHTRIPETAWIFDRLNKVIESLNNQYYGFDLNGYTNFQYTSYNGEEKGKYGWHLDLFVGIRIPADMIQPRKLSITLLLNDPSEFEGGEFQIADGDQEKAVTIPFTRGKLIAFPSFMLHQVTPVTRGFRKSLVVWVTGPKFS